MLHRVLHNNHHSDLWLIIAVWVGTHLTCVVSEATLLYRRVNLAIIVNKNSRGVFLMKLTLQICVQYSKTLCSTEKHILLVFICCQWVSTENLLEVLEKKGVTKHFMWHSYRGPVCWKQFCIRALLMVLNYPVTEGIEVVSYFFNKYLCLCF